MVLDVTRSTSSSEVFEEKPTGEIHQILYKYLFLSMQLLESYITINPDKFKPSIVTVCNEMLALHPHLMDVQTTDFTIPHADLAIVMDTALYHTDEKRTSLNTLCGCAAGVRGGANTVKTTSFEIAYPVAS